MRLIAFALDLPYIENEENIVAIINEKGYERNEAIRQDYEANWKQKRREFALQTRCITACFERLFGYMNTRDCKKITINCMPEVPVKSIKKFSGGFYEVQTKFCYTSFTKLNDYEKKKISLDLLMAGVRQIAKAQKWDMAQFEQVYEAIVAAEWKNEWVWKKPVSSPDKKAVAHVFLHHEVRQMDIYLVICDKNGREVVKERIVSEEPDEWVYTQHLGEIKWIDDRKVALVNKNKDRTLSVNYS